ncbi:MAG: Swt1 family HEPN domain-containing protein [Euryarchaeota archaeon]|nr:Swt1 family HEPN domain-containing protein [Euryarchaeota archaeon]
MTDFSYKAPDEDNYLRGLIKYLKYHNEDEIASILKGSKCKILDSSQYSQKRWNAVWTEILFEVPFDKLELTNDKIRKNLVKFCDDIMPKEVGFDVMSVDFKPRLDEEEKPDILADLNKTTSAISGEVLSKILNDDLIERGKSMSEVYIYLYCIENSLRIFIEKILKDKYGDDFSNQFSRGIKRTTATRKGNEQKNKWLTLRGSSDLFYLDFKELSSVIRTDWSLFENYFPSQEWITSKIEDLSQVRNLIAHNSFVSEQERKLMKSYFEIILKQIDQNL